MYWHATVQYWVEFKSFLDFFRYLIFTSFVHQRTVRALPGGSAEQAVVRYGVAAAQITVQWQLTGAESQIGPALSPFLFKCPFIKQLLTLTKWEQLCGRCFWFLMWKKKDEIHNCFSLNWGRVQKNERRRQLERRTELSCVEMKTSYLNKKIKNNGSLKVLWIAARQSAPLQRLLWNCCWLHAAPQKV